MDGLRSVCILSCKLLTSLLTLLLTVVTYLSHKHPHILRTFSLRTISHIHLTTQPHVTYGKIARLSEGVAADPADKVLYY